MKVKNINGTSGNTCKCVSWLVHWETFSGEKSNICVEKTCMRDATVGAHIQKDGSDRSWYIIPLCTAHNKKTDEMELINSPILVSANISETCGKRGN